MRERAFETHMVAAEQRILGLLFRFLQGGVRLTGHFHAVRKQGQAGQFLKTTLQGRFAGNNLSDLFRVVVAALDHQTAFRRQVQMQTLFQIQLTGFHLSVQQGHEGFL